MLASARLPAFLEVASILGNVAPSAGLELGARLLGVTQDGLAKVSPRSHLNRDGTPLEICISVGPNSRAVRLVGDPVAAPAMADRKRASLAAIRRVVGERCYPPAPAQVERLLATALPRTDAELEGYLAGLAWMGADLRSPGVVVYAAPDPDAVAAWDRAAGCCDALLARPQPARALLAAVRDAGPLASIALDIGRKGTGVLKFYWRLDRAVTLASLGPLWAQPEYASFLLELVGDREMNFSGLVLSQGFRVDDGEPVGTKLDLCAHCIDRPSDEWVEAVARVERRFGLLTSGIERTLRSGEAEMAFVGLGRKRDGQLRLNVYLRPPRLERSEVPVSVVRRAAAYLMEAQHPDGSWSDYRLPVGASTHWVTAYAGLALTYAHQVFDLPAAGRAADRAACWLIARSMPGWGFNDHTGPDADSTALALRLLNRVGETIRHDDTKFLLEHRHPDGGFSTYRRPDAWGSPHACVTGQAIKALAPALHPGQSAGYVDYLNKARLNRGQWPSYWWTTSHYATFQCLSALRQLGQELPLGPFDEPLMELGCFDLVHAWGAAMLTGECQRAAPLLDRLLALQQSDGRWPGSPSLRVTDAGCSTPWLQPARAVYTDHRGILTTAAALVVFGEVSGLGADAGRCQ